MKRNERLGVAVTAAVVGAAVSAAITRSGGRLPLVRREQLQLLPVNDPIQLAPIDATPSAATSSPPPPTPSQPAARRGWGLPADRLAGAVSLLSIGALLTLVVLWTTGTFDGQAVGSQAVAATATAPVDPDLPVTAADLAEEQGDAAPAAPEASEAPAAPLPTGPQVADPVRIEIPAIGVAADIIPLGLVPDSGELEVPQDFAQTGWWTGGPEPGEIGPAVIAGHVDSFEGPAVFFDLDQLAFDDLVRITRADGSAATFAIRETIAVDKDEFPTEFVYGPTDVSVLRLITCDGDFTDGSYLGNLIVTAELLAEHPAPETGLIS